MRVHPSAISRVLPPTAQAGVINPWTLSAEEYPAHAAVEEQLWFLLHYAILAPSTHNSQPWLFRIRDQEIEIRADWSRALPVADSDGRELVASCGAALLHLRLALHYFGHDAAVETYPDPAQPELLARVRMGPRIETDAEEILLFQAIQQRHTNRQPYEPAPLPTGLPEALIESARSEGAWLHFVEDDTARHSLADLVAEADRVQWTNREFRRELAAWLRPNDAPGHDGIPGFAEGLGDLASHAGPFVIRTFDLGKGQAAKDREIALHSPVLAVLGTDGDTPMDWLAAGQALARVLLRARSDGVSASFLNQPIEVESLREQLATLTGRPGSSPQVVLRMGVATPGRPTPRRPVRDVLQATPDRHRSPAHDSDI